MATSQTVLEVNVQIVVDHAVTHPDDCGPGNLRMSLPESGRDPAGRLADCLKQMNEGQS